MEKPGKYSGEENDSVKHAKVISSAYFRFVAQSANSMIMAGSLGLGYPITVEKPDEESIDATISLAIAFTDKLIEKVGEKL